MRGTPQSDGRLANLIRLQREELGWSQEDAGRESGISKSRWRQIEHGEPAPAGTVARMLDALEIRPETARELGRDDIAKALRMRHDLLGRERMPPWIAGETEAHLWKTPAATDAERRYLITSLRVMRADPRLAADGNGSRNGRRGRTG